MRHAIASPRSYLHYCGIFLARFLITIVPNIISSLRIVLSLCVRDVCKEVTKLIKADVDVNAVSLEYLTRARFGK